MVKISVILPVYNEEKYIFQCLDSLCNQTLQDIEIICVDDGSTDNSLQILKDFQKNDSRIHIMTQTNQYAGVARNNGMLIAQGKYLLFLDSDDFFDVRMLEKMYQAAEENSLDITICRYDLYSDISKQKLTTNFKNSNSFIPKNKQVFSGEEVEHAAIFQVTVGWAWDKLFRSEFVEECGFKFSDFCSSEDGFFVYMLMAKAKRIGIIQERLVYHRMYNSNSLSNNHARNWRNGFRMLESIGNELKREGIYKVYEQSFLSILVTFQTWYLDTMYEKTAYDNCYEYIQTVMEPQFQALQYEGKLLCSEEQICTYREIVQRTSVDFLFYRLKQKEARLRAMNKSGWVFPYEKVPMKSRVIIYGAGSVGTDYVRQLLHTKYCKELYVVDKNYLNCRNAYSYTVQSPEVITEIEFDYIVISILNEKIQKEIRQMLNSMGVEDKKIVCLGE